MFWWLAKGGRSLSSLKMIMPLSCPVTCIEDMDGIQTLGRLFSKYYSWCLVTHLADQRTLRHRVAQHKTLPAAKMLSVGCAVITQKRSCSRRNVCRQELQETMTEFILECCCCLGMGITHVQAGWGGVEPVFVLFLFFPVGHRMHGSMCGYRLVMSQTLMLLSSELLMIISCLG